MAETKINNLDSKKLSRDCLSKNANNICNGIPSVINNNDNMTKGLFDDGKVFYLNPTEELRMGDIVKPGRSTATVLSSGDFAIDSIYRGARDVLTFDINKFQLYFASLKLKFLQNMSYEDYCGFFSDEDNYKFMSPNTYKILKKVSSVDKDLYTFMDVVFKKFSKARKNVRNNIKKDFLYQLIYEVNNGSMFNDTLFEEMVKKMDITIDDDSTDLYLNYVFNKFGFDYKSPEVLQLMHGLMTYKERNNYLENKDTYNKTKSLIKDSKIKFVNCDVSNLKYKLKEAGCLNPDFRGFQSIYLSNIPEYMSGKFFRNIIDNELMELLSDDGVIAYCCQGISSKSLENGRLAVAKDEIEDFFMDRDIISKSQYKNNIDGYSLLKKKYNVFIDEAPSMSMGNGFEDKDTFVYVKKR